MGGKGVDGAIHTAAGKMLHDECLTLNGCHTGEAKISGGYNLPAKHVIHTVGPIGVNPIKLKSCYVKSLEIAMECDIRSIAFPCISTGAYNYPNREASAVAVATVREFLNKNPLFFDRVIFIVYRDIDMTFYHKFMSFVFPTEIKSQGKIIY